MKFALICLNLISAIDIPEFNVPFQEESTINDLYCDNRNCTDEDIQEIQSELKQFEDDYYNQSKTYEIYVGVGKVERVQHQMVGFERFVMMRSNENLTSLAGYAGGWTREDQTEVCTTRFWEVWR